MSIALSSHTVIVLHECGMWAELGHSHSLGKYCVASAIFLSFVIQ